MSISGVRPKTCKPNDSEIASLRFVAATDFETELARFPERFTPWCKQEWSELRSRYQEQLAGYCDIA